MKVVVGAFYVVPVVALVWATFSFTACEEPDVIPDAQVFDATPASGSFTLTWTITKGGVPVTCADVNGAFVRITLTPLSGAGGFNELFDCTTGMGMSALARPEHYRVVFDLLDTNGVAVPTAVAPLTDFAIVPGANTAMPDVVFDAPSP